MAIQDPNRFTSREAAEERARYLRAATVRHHEVVEQNGDFVVRGYEHADEIPPGYAVYKDKHGWRFTSPDGANGPEFANIADAKMKARAHYTLNSPVAG